MTAGRRRGWRRRRRAPELHGVWVRVLLGKTGLGPEPAWRRQDRPRWSIRQPIGDERRDLCRVPRKVKGQLLVRRTALSLSPPPPLVLIEVVVVVSAQLGLHKAIERRVRVVPIPAARVIQDGEDPACAALVNAVFN